MTEGHSITIKYLLMKNESDNQMLFFLENVYEYNNLTTDLWTYVEIKTIARMIL